MIIFLCIKCKFLQKVLTNSQKCAAQLIRYTHLIGGFTVQKYCNIVKNKLNTLIINMEKNISDFVAVFLKNNAVYFEYGQPDS